MTVTECTVPNLFDSWGNFEPLKEFAFHEYSRSNFNQSFEQLHLFQSITPIEGVTAYQFDSRGRFNALQRLASQECITTINSNPSHSSTPTNWVHHLKAKCSITFIEEGILMPFRDLHSMNACLPIFSSPSHSSTSTNSWQPENAPWPISLAVGGNFMRFRDSHSLNHLFHHILWMLANIQSA